MSASPVDLSRSGGAVDVRSDVELIADAVTALSDIRWTDTPWNLEEITQHAIVNHHTAAGSQDYASFTVQQWRGVAQVDAECGWLVAHPAVSGIAAELEARREARFIYDTGRTEFAFPDDDARTEQLSGRLRQVLAGLAGAAAADEGEGSL